MIHPVIDTCALVLAQGYTRISSRTSRAKLPRGSISRFSAHTWAPQIFHADQPGRIRAGGWKVHRHLRAGWRSRGLDRDQRSDACSFPGFAVSHRRSRRNAIPSWGSNGCISRPRSFLALRICFADGQVRKANEPFDVGGEELMYPRDPSGSPENTINCHCFSGRICRRNH
jgi:hypothetical protein